LKNRAFAVDSEVNLAMFRRDAKASECAGSSVVEHSTFNRMVEGSNPSRHTTFLSSDIDDPSARSQLVRQEFS
jgi:hypothetical protein